MRTTRIAFGAVAVSLLLAASPSGWPADPESREDSRPVFNSAVRKDVVREIANKLRKRYVYPEAGATIASTILARMFQGAYLEIESPREFADRLTHDLVEASHDHHFQVLYDPTMEGSGPPNESDSNGESRRPGGLAPFGFEQLEILQGNVGYLKLTTFAPVDLGAETARAAMAFLADSDVIVIDLRDNRGGSPSMVPLLMSYFFGEEPVHLTSIHWRNRSTTTEAWTHAKVGGKRMPATPLYVLTSGETFSIAEEFAYSLKHLGRAKIVGRKTRGGAHRGGHVAVGSGFALFVPTGATISPVTGTNWEGVGVQPDLDVPADEALEAALRDARNPAR